MQSPTAMVRSVKEPFYRLLPLFDYDGLLRWKWAVNADGEGRSRVISRLLRGLSSARRHLHPAAKVLLEQCSAH